MRRFRITSVLFCAVLSGFISLAGFAEAQQVVGSCKLTRLSGEVLNLAFSAVQHADGTVTGQAQVSFRTGNTVLFISHLDIDCMLFLDDRTVILGGVTSLDSDPEFVGTTAVLTVRDNGEGSGDPPDESSETFYSLDLGFEIDCELAALLIESGAVDLEELLRPAETGNIQVRP